MPIARTEYPYSNLQARYLGLYLRKDKVDFVQIFLQLDFLFFTLAEHALDVVQLPKVREDWRIGSH